MQEQMTSEEIQRHYDAAMDSVNYINELIAGDHDATMSAEEKADAIGRNVAHLEIMVAKDFWEGQDMAPLNAAIAAGKAA
jgi:hypothetical protein